MKEIFLMHSLKTNVMKDGDTEIILTLKTQVGPGTMPAIYDKLVTMAHQQVMASINLVQAEIDTMTGEVK